MSHRLRFVAFCAGHAMQCYLLNYRPMVLQKNVRGKVQEHRRLVTRELITEPTFPDLPQQDNKYLRNSCSNKTFLFKKSRPWSWVYLKLKYLSLDYSDWSELHTIFADSRRMASVDDICDVFVGLWCFFHDQFWRGDSDRNIFLLHLVENVHVVDVAS
jgi:hypothetical protein